MNVLIVDDEPGHIELIRQAFAEVSPGVEVSVAGTLKEYRARISVKTPDIALLDLNLPDGSAVSALSYPPEANPFPILIMSSRGDEKAAVAAIKAGALDYIVKSAEVFAAFPRTVKQALRQWAALKARLGAERALVEERNQLDAIFASSPVALLVVDEKMNIVRANAGVSVLAGVGLTEITSHYLGKAVGCINSSVDPRGCGYSPACPLCGLRNAVAELLVSGDPLPELETQMSFVRAGETRRVWLLVGASAITLAGRRHAIVAMSDITDKKEAEKAEERSRARYAAIFGHSPIAIEYYDAAACLVGANEACIAMFGVVAINEIAGSKLFNDPNITAEAKAALKRQEPARLEVVFDFDKVKKDKVFNTTRSGKAILAYYIAPMLENNNTVGYVAQIQDITESKRAEEALRESETKYRELIENLNDLVYTLDVKGFVTYIGPQVLQLVGYKPEEMIGCSIAKVIHPDDMAEVWTNFRRNIENARRPVEFRCMHKNGSIRWARASSRPIISAGNVSGMSGLVMDITESKLAEDQLREKTALLEAQVNTSIDGILVVDPEDKRVLMNKRLVELFCVPKEIADNPEDKPLLEHVTSLVKYPEKFIEKVRHLNAHGGESSRDEIEFKNGMVLDRYSAPIIGSTGHNYGRIWTFRDITDRKAAETAALRRSEMLVAINSSGDVRTLLRKATKLLRDWSGCEEAGVRLKDGMSFPYFATRGASGEFVMIGGGLCCHAPDESDKCKGPTAPAADCMCANVLNGRVDTSLPFFTAKGSFWSSRAAEAARIRCAGKVRGSAAIIPLKVGSEVLGLLQFKSAAVGRFDPGNIGFFEDAADKLAMAVAHFRAEEALRESEARLKKAQAMALVGNWEASLKTGEIWTSVEARRIYGFALDFKMTLDSVQGPVLAKYRPEKDAALKRLKAGECGYDLEFEIKKQDTGEIVWIHAKTELTLDKDGEPKVVGILQDITESKRAQAALRESEARYTTFINSTSDLVFLKDERLRYVVANEAQCRFFGRTLEQVIGLTDKELMPEQAEKLCRESDLRAIEADAVLINREAVGDRWFETLKFPVALAGNKVGVGGFIRDITERMMAETALAVSEVKYRELVENINDLIFVLDVNGSVTYVSPQVFPMMGYKPEELTGEHFKKIVYPEDYLAVENVFQGRKKNLLSPLEWRCFRKDGAVRWVRTSSRPIVENGRITGIRGLLSDITERKRAEGILEDIIEKNPMSIQIVDVEGFTLKVNPAFVRLFVVVPPPGFSIFSDIRRRSPELYKYILRAKAGEVVHLPDTYYNPHDALADMPSIPVWLHAVIFPLRDSSGKVDRLVLMHEDITARKLTDDGLKESMERFNQLAEQSRTAVWEVDANGRYTYVSHVFSSLTGYKPEEMIGKVYFYDIHPEEGREDFKKAAFDIFSRKAKFTDLPNMIRTKDGRIIWVSTNGVPILDAKKRLTGYRGSDRDITEGKLSEDKIRTSLAEKEVLLKEVHHRVKNNLQVVSSLLNLQAKTLKDEAAQAVFRESRARVRAMALVHEILYRTQDFSRLNMRDYAGKLVEGLMASYGVGGQVNLVCDICDCPLSVDTAVSLGLILNELVSNSFKYAFAGGRAGTLTVKLSGEGGGYCLSVENDGPALPADYDLRKAGTLGMQLVTTLARQIGGTVEQAPAAGARFLVKFKG